MSTTNTYMTQKLEEFLTTTGGNKYDTRKTNNRRAGINVPMWLIEEIESDTVTIEAIEEIQDAFDIFRYKTCITIHGEFTDLERDRVGGYKNLIRNGNGSLQVKYNAIDYTKKKQIAKELAAVKSDWRYFRDSLGDLFIQESRITSTEQQADILSTYREIAEALNGEEFWGEVKIILYDVPMLGKLLRLSCRIDAIREEQLRNVILAMWNGNDEQEFERLLEVARQERERQLEADAIEQQKREDARAALTEKMEMLRAAIAHLRDFNPNVFQYGVLVKAGRYIVFKVAKKLAFNKVQFEAQYCEDLKDYQMLDFKPMKNAIKPKDWKQLKGL